MITVRARYVPTEKATAPPRDNSYPKSAEEAHEWLAGLLQYCNVRQVVPAGDNVSIIVQEIGRNTGSLFEWTFTGLRSEMIPCLVAAYYWYDRDCVEPPADYPFSEPTTRQRVLDQVRDTLPVRDAVGDLLRAAGYVPPVLEGMYDTRGCAAAWVGVMAYAGITDEPTLQIGRGMDFGKLFEICAYVRLLGLTFDEARAQLA